MTSACKLFLSLSCFSFSVLHSMASLAAQHLNHEVRNRKFLRTLCASNTPTHSLAVCWCEEVYTYWGFLRFVIWLERERFWIWTESCTTSSEILYPGTQCTRQVDDLTGGRVVQRAERAGKCLKCDLTGDRLAESHSGVYQFRFYTSLQTSWTTGRSDVTISVTGTDEYIKSTH